MLAAFKPFDHQKEAWNNMDKEFLDGKRERGMVVVPTGGGKTTIAVYWLIKNFINKGYRVLWLAHRIELLDQAFATFEKFVDLAIDENLRGRMIKISNNYGKWSQVDKSDLVVFSTDRSAALNKDFLQLLVQQSDKGVFIVIDEAHHSVASGYREVIETLFKCKKKSRKDIRLLGLTATPTRMNPDETRILWRLYDDNYNILKLNRRKSLPFNSIVHNVSMEELIQKNILARPYPSTVQTDINFEKDFTEEDYKYLEQFGELSVRVLERVKNSSIRNNKIVEHYIKNKDKFGKTLVFAVDIAHCITLRSEFQKKGIRADYIASNRSHEENQQILDEYRNPEGSIDVLISVEKLLEGFDAPLTQTIFITRPTRSEVLLRQMIGRGLRGIKAGGTAKAYLVTFVDTWKLFKPIAADYIIEDESIDLQQEEKPSYTNDMVQISEKLILSAYELLKSKVAINISSVYDALPEAWYTWTRDIDGEDVEEYIIIFDNQLEAYEEMREYYQNNTGEIPDVLSYENLEQILYKFFDDCPDPLPSLADIRSLLSAIRNGSEIEMFSFKEKDEFNPVILANKYKNLNREELVEKLREIFNKIELCRQTYRYDFHSFYKDVSDEIDQLILGEIVIDEKGKKKVDPINKEKLKLEEWPDGQGYDLEEIVRQVAYLENGEVNKRHFPDGAPEKYKITFTRRVKKSYFGNCRYSDKTIKINRILNSPSVPLYVLEFLIYHELLHVDMPYNGHDSLYRERERKFMPSRRALAEVEGELEDISLVDNYWYAVSNQFLDTLSYNYDIEVFK